MTYNHSIIQMTYSVTSTISSRASSTIPILVGYSIYLIYMSRVLSMIPNTVSSYDTEYGV